MDKKSKIFFIVFFLLIAASVAATYYRYIVAHDYVIEAEADCDPYTEVCFTYVCDPEVGEECTGDPLEDTSYYKIISRNAKNIPLCDPEEEGCEALICPEDEEDCEITFCDPATAAEEMICTDPAAYTLENSIEEDAATGEDEMGGETGKEEDGTEDTESDASEETMSVRDSLVLLDEVSCGKGKTFVYSDVTDKTPVDEEGNYDAVFSAEEAQIIFLANGENQACAQAVSLPEYDGKIYLDAKSTAEAAVFQTEGILTADPEEAAKRLDFIERAVSFPALLAYVRTALPDQDLATLAQRPDFQNLVRQCAAEVESKLHRSFIARPF